MKPRCHSPAIQRGGNGFTLLELLAVIVTVAVLAGLFLPAVTNSGMKACRINCVSNIKQIGLAFRMWSNDHHEEFPWRVSANAGGTLELVEQGVIHAFRAISNELTTPKVLVCPNDRSRTRATAFHPLSGGGTVALLNNAATQVSYFIGLDASETRPQSILTGDRNLQGGQLSPSWILKVTSNDRLAFTAELHDGQGNLGLGDGSAQQVSPLALNRQIEAAFPTNQSWLRLALPQ